MMMFIAVFQLLVYSCFVHDDLQRCVLISKVIFKGTFGFLLLEIEVFFGAQSMVSFYKYSLGTCKESYDFLKHTNHCFKNSFNILYSEKKIGK